MENSDKQSVFFSYSHQDSLCAHGISRFLQRQNYDVWIDTDKLSTGQNWAMDINTALNTVHAVVALISKNSVRRTEVLRELSIALNRKEREENFRIVFVVIGNVHPSWFVNRDTDVSDRIITYLQTVQFVQLDARGTITLSGMHNILRALNGEMIYFEKNSFQEENEYIYEAGIPGKVYDNEANNYFYRLHSSDLAPSTVYPFALDNQWLPDEVLCQDSLLKSAFVREGFASGEVQQYLEEFQTKNLYLSLMHSRQIIINRASLLNSFSLRRFYSDQENCNSKDRAAFASLLGNGSIVVFLYGDNQLTPYVSSLPQYATIRNAVEQWNVLCSKIPMYCIRENWEIPIDRHKQEIGKYCMTLANDREANHMIASSFGFEAAKTEEFFSVLKEIEMAVFLQTHIIGTGHRSEVEGYSRSAFYKNFVVAEHKKDGIDPVLNCIFDQSKPFHEELKKMMDIYYNSIFTNLFNCAALIPAGMHPNETFLYQLYLKHGIKEISTDELEYAFSEFFTNESILRKIKEIGNDFYIRNWDLERIVKFRNGLRWREYVELLEMVANRATYWKVDFSELGNLVDLFVAAIRECSQDGILSESSETFVPAYTFRICIGTVVLDVVCNEKVRKLKKYAGVFMDESQNHISIQFFIGDATLRLANQNDTIFLPIKIFDGKTNYIGGLKYFTELCNFFVTNCDFVWVY